MRKDMRNKIPKIVGLIEVCRVERFKRRGRGGNARRGAQRVLYGEGKGNDK